MSDVNITDDVKTLEEKLMTMGNEPIGGPNTYIVWRYLIRRHMINYLGGDNIATIIVDGFIDNEIDWKSTFQDIQRMFECSVLSNPMLIFRTRARSYIKRMLEYDKIHRWTSKVIRDIVRDRLGRDFYVHV